MVLDFNEGEIRGLIQQLARLLLSYTYLLPPHSMSDDAGFLMTCSADPEPAVSPRLLGLSDILELRVPGELRDAITTLSRALRAAADAQRGVAPEPSDGHGLPLQDGEVVDALAEFESLIDDRAWVRVTEFRLELADSPGERTMDNLALLCGGTARAIAARVTTDDARRRLWQVVWWALQHERTAGNSGRISHRLNQVGTVLDHYPPVLRRDLLMDHLVDFLTLVRSDAKQQFLAWLTGIVGEADDGLAELHAAASARFAEVTGASAVPAYVTGTAGSGPGITPEQIVTRLKDAWVKQWTPADAAPVIEQCWRFLDAKKEQDNRRKFDRVLQGDRNAAAQLAGGQLRSAMWRCRHREPGQHDAIQLADLEILASLGAISGNLGTSRRSSGPSGDLVAVFGMTLLMWERLTPAAYARFIELLAAEQSDEAGRKSVQQAGAVELLRYLNRPVGLAFLRRNPEPWVETLKDWADRYERSQLEQLVELLRTAGAQDSFGLHLLRTASEPAPDNEVNSIFGPADTRRFDEYYQQGQLAPIAELLNRNPQRLLAVVEADLSDQQHAEFRPPAGKVAVKVGGRDIFSELKRKAELGNPQQASEAHSGFDRALRDERREYARRVLSEWKAYALFRGSSVLEAEPVWVEAAESGTASDEVYWNLAVRKKKLGTPYRGLRHLAERIEDNRLSLEYVQFACALAVATLQQAMEPSRGEQLAGEQKAAQDFLLKYARTLVIPSAHLLWFWLAYGDPERPIDDTAGTALVTYTGLRADSHRLPTVQEISSLAFEDRLAAIDRVARTLEQLRDPHFHLTWRLWIGEYARQSPWWWPVWDHWASACEQADDPQATIEVLREAANSAVRMLKRPNLSEKDRGTKSRFLRAAVLRLLRYARELDRTSLHDEIRDRYVQPVPELRDTEDPKNRQLLTRLGLLSPPDPGTRPPTPSTSPAVWPSLHEPLSDVLTVEDLNDPLVRRLEAALQVDPGMQGRHTVLVEAAQELLREVARLRVGLPAAQVTGTVLGLSGRLNRLTSQVKSAHLDQLVPLLGMQKRVLTQLASSKDAAPVPTVTIADGWTGWPDDLESSSVPLVLSFPGPGVAHEVSATGGWSGDAYRAQAEIRSVQNLSPEQPLCYALALHNPNDGPALLRVDIRYSWGPLTGLVRSTEIEVRHGFFSGYLDQHGISAHEFPDPFEVNRPLDRDQVLTDLFQGRDQQLAEVRQGYTQAGFQPLPLCFYGIRKTGKTSLLQRVLVEIEKAGLVGLEVNLLGQRADTHDMDQLCLGLLTKIREAAIRAGADQDAMPVPDQHPNPTLLVESFFDQLADQFEGRRVVALLDEYQGLQRERKDGTRPGEPVLDSLRPVHEKGRVGFIAFSNQGLDPTHRTESQLALRTVRVDFLRENEVARSVGGPLRQFGVHVHPSAMHRIFEEAAGHPNFSAMLAKVALERLNIEHRNIMTITDVEAATNQILNAPNTFRLSWFSPDNLSPAEVEAAIGLAKEDVHYAGYPVDEAATRLGMSTEMANDLEAKRVIEVKLGSPATLRIRGRLLWRYLRQQVSVGPVPQPFAGTAESVGLYVDLENLRPHKPKDMSYGELADRLSEYAAGLGELKTRWMAIASWNTGEDWDRIKAELSAAHFLVVQEPASFRARRREDKRDVADFVLAGQVLDETAEIGLTRVVIATGDGDLLILVNQLIEKDVPVRLISGDRDSRSNSWLHLAEDRRAIAVAKGLTSGEADFDVLLLDEILNHPGAASPGSI